ncbi:MAG TPA: HAD family hydrolase [Chloroflexota bacterium]|nr:HAD family hydrolase [Chloroflexota bacterium]
MRRPRAVTFDALGTLVELEPPGPLLRAGLQERAGVEISPAQADAALAAEISYYRAHLDEGHDRESLAGLRRRCTKRLREALPASAHGIELDSLEAILLAALRFRAFADAREAIEAARRLPARVLVVSNWDVSLEDVLLRLHLTPLLDGVITSAGAGARKPSPAIFARALELAGVAPERAVHVGDSVEEDVQGARRAGIEPILLSRDGRPGAPGVRTISGLGQLAPELWRSSSA